jgi:hypothetical protein
VPVSLEQFRSLPQEMLPSSLHDRYLPWMYLLLDRFLPYAILYGRRKVKI